jgi:nitroreductase/dihydropteridine reductase
MSWRYAVKQYDTSRRVPEAAVVQLQEVLRLAPSSHGLQPYRVLFVTDEALRTRLRAASYQQAQVSEASHLAVFAIETNVDAVYVERYFDLLTRVRQIELTGNLLQHKQSVLASVARMSSEQRQQWATNQAYLALGVLLTAAAQLGVDANPMEGFVASQYDELLDLPAQGLHAVVIAGLGYRHPTDPFQRFQKVRWPASEFFVASPATLAASQS